MENVFWMFFPPLSIVVISELANLQLFIFDCRRIERQYST